MTSLHITLFCVVNSRFVWVKDSSAEWMGENILTFFLQLLSPTYCKETRLVGFLFWFIDPRACDCFIYGFEFYRDRCSGNSVNVVKDMYGGGFYLVQKYVRLELFTLL